MSVNEVTRGSSSHYGVEIRLSCMQLSMIAYALKTTKPNWNEDDWNKLQKNMEVLSNLPLIKGLRHYGSFDESRLNWKK